MGCMRVAVVASVLGFASAQEVKPGAAAPKQEAGRAALVTRFLPVAGLARFALPATEATQEPVGKRLERLLQRLVRKVGDEAGAGAVAAERRILQLARNVARGEVILFRQPPAEAELITGVLGQLALESPLHASVQYSVVTMPAAVATAHGLRAGLMPAVDDAVITAMTRDACRRGGSLHNLPEVRSAPLRPFTVDGPGAANAMRFVLRGEMVPVADDEVVLVLDLVRRVPVPDQPQQAQEVMQPNVRLAAGRTALVVAVAGDSVTALVVRCVECKQAPLELPK